MGSQERRAIIELPVKVILTEVGTTFFINNRKNLKKFKLADNVEEYGILLDKFTPSSLQRMMLIDYVSKIEISTSEFLTIRQEVMDIAKLITYSMLYRQYDSYIFQRVLSSDVIKNWNRKNAANIIDEKTKINDNFLQNALKTKQKDIAEIKQAILAPMYAFISKNSTLLAEEKNVQLLLSEKFLNNLRPFTWFIITKFKDSEGYDILIKDVRTSLAEYMEKAKVAEFVALNIMELVTNAENSNLKREAKSIFKGAVDMNAVLFDPNIRRQVMDSLQRKGELVSISWKIGSRGSSIGTQGKLQITIFNKESQYEKMKEQIDQKKSADLKKKSLMDFYKELPDGESNTELGLYYLSYLSEACEKVNVKFESLVNQISGSDLTVITLAINF
ncbi:MAG: hypothetical protein A2087_05630 [Spirochaetes bacterium GWD1_61_31]|nr:MAG: hypothetical protein A2Y37_03560 [Spirochaetes bacterium GWB1_60_80]OHD35116.1 MAG: hypothetical protein A2004_05375 [Spirochaetes bacterium GWC1_61_12]OHD43635.1 MAG: hypothetical protein A2087_05630 [Spirochaetes bacterium GWD1_61_31]OHD44127.1 MAG: hypothetical protein A2Y35_02055 [Spirochaetes bacterium GWE1_60_18]OHD61832.1 MAG: hypothetical protein A2Y32_13820 [Spirochaetes bacterium GWF1_60_12]HAW85104.1 hypothetical protein [Spirochaetaceae bacterium]